MRVDLGVAMTGKMLEGGEHAVVVQAAHVLGDEPRHGARVLPERARIDDRVGGIVVDIRVGCEIDVDADRAALGGRGDPDGVGIPRVAGGSDGHDLWECRGAHHEGVDPARRDLEKRIVQRGVASQEPGNDELAHALPHRERGEDGVGGDRRRGPGAGGRGGGGDRPRRVSAGTAEHRRHDQESMRPHSLSLLLGLVCAAPAAAQVRPGIEVLLSDSIGLVAGKRVALLTNQTGVNRLGQRDIDLVRGTPGVRLLVILSPEHGLRGTEDRPGLPDAVDSASGLPIYSLYGGTPLSAIAGLDSVDVVLVDLQDIGARYYSYSTTAVLLLPEAARRGKPLVVLDRPNPVGGVAVQGNVPATARALERTGDFLPVPMRHG